MSGDYADYYTKSPIFSSLDSGAGCLFANGREPVRLSAGDLPRWFLPVRIYGTDGFISAKGIAAISYHPSLVSPMHLFRDDSLVVRYAPRDSAEKRSTRIVLWGASIVPFLQLAKAYSPKCDMIQAEKELRRKMDFLSSFISSEEAP